MNTSKTPIKRTLAVLKMPKRNADRLTFAQSIVGKMTGNPNFTTPPPTISLATMQLHIDALRKSDAAAKVRGAGLVAQREVDWEVVKADLILLQHYVQEVADGTPARAAEIIGGAGMLVKKPAVRTKPDLSATNGNTSGTVLLVGRGLRSRCHEWQMSKDGVNWTDLPTTLGAKTTVAGLAYGTTVSFRHRAKITSGDLPWTNPVSILVK